MYKNITPVRIAVFTFALTLAISGCEAEKPAVTDAPKPDAAPPAPPAPRSLFERLGGQEGLTAIVDGFISNIGADPRTRVHFTNIDMGRLKPKTVEYLCEKTAGPCKYTGGEVKTMAKPLQLGNADFDAFMEDLTKSLDNKQVAQSDKDELLGILGKLRTDVVATYGGGP
ncbi:MAG: group I truncated hemoglobin [Gammaproteobacteria bacterium]